MCFLKRCDLTPRPMEIYSLRDSEQNVMSVALLLRTLAPGESLELPHGPGRESQGLCSLTVQFWNGGVF